MATTTRYIVINTTTKQGMVVKRAFDMGDRTGSGYPKIKAAFEIFLYSEIRWIYVLLTVALPLFPRPSLDPGPCSPREIQAQESRSR